MKWLSLIAVVVSSPGLAVPLDPVLDRNIDTLWDCEDSVQRALPGDAAFTFEIDEQAIASLLERADPLQCVPGADSLREATFIVEKARTLAQGRLRAPTRAIHIEAIANVLAASEGYEFCTSRHFADTPYEGELTDFVVIRRTGNDMLFGFSQFWE